MIRKILDIRELKRGTHILVETPGEVYELTVGTPARCVVLMASDRRFERRDKFVLLASADCDTDTGIFYPHCIYGGLGMRLKPRKRPGFADIVTTGPANRVTITVDGVTTELWSTNA